MIDLSVDEWTQEEFLRNKQTLETQGIRVLLIDTILNPIDGTETTLYAPPLLKKEPEGSVFVFYCDTGKSSKERLKEFRTKFPDHVCISLRGGRGYWRKNFRI
ncbi:hypothetical protein [Sulfuricurvum sp.]|uniref:hypothetical protein n=1 Tax=Sulfuricurvum sp. TaxID=2025608 RepID=UPI003C3E17D8